jgi:hypothetical protein
VIRQIKSPIVQEKEIDFLYPDIDKNYKLTLYFNSQQVTKPNRHNKTGQAQKKFMI